MRNPERIDVVMWLLTKIWKEQPDTRFHQLVHNLQWEYSKEKDSYKQTFYERDNFNGIMMFREYPIVDLYNVEDEDFIAFLKRKLTDG